MMRIMTLNSIIAASMKNTHDIDKKMKINTNSKNNLRKSTPTLLKHHSSWLTPIYIDIHIYDID